MTMHDVTYDVFFYIVLTVYSYTGFMINDSNKVYIWNMQIFFNYKQQLENHGDSKV